MGIVHVCRTSQARCLREFAINKLGNEKVALMSDGDITELLESEGFQSYIEYCGEYDDSDDILVAKPKDIEELVRNGKAFWADRSGRLDYAN